MTDADRACRWLQALAIERSTTVREVPGGLALLHADLPLAHSHNLLLILSPADADAVADAAESVFDEAQIKHQSIEVHDSEVADALAPGLLARGYARCDVALMRPVTASRPTSQPGSRPGITVETLTLEERIEMGSSTWADDPSGMPPEEIRQLGERIRCTAVLVDATFLAVRDDEGVVVASGDIY